MSDSYPINEYSGSFSGLPRAYSQADYSAISGIDSAGIIDSNLVGIQEDYLLSRKSSVNSGSFVTASNLVQAPQIYRSEIEEAILNASDPLPLNDDEEINLNGIRGFILNKQELLNWSGDYPINQYEINQDTNPLIVNKRPSQQIEFVQEMGIRYLKPPTPAPPGEILIKQNANVLTGPAPPVIIRQPPARPQTPEPLVIREAPPLPPPQLSTKYINLPGKRIPPPPRKVVVEKFEELPRKPQNILVERWLPYIPQKRKVIFQAAPPDPVVVKPRNIIVQWAAPKVVVRREVKYLGVVRADPATYVNQYGSLIKQSNQLPDIVNKINTPDNLVLAANVEYSGLHELEGDVHALNLVDLDKVGLGQYKSHLGKFISRPTSAFEPDILAKLPVVSNSIASVPAAASASVSVPAVTSESAPVLPYRSTTSLGSLVNLGFPRPNSAVYGSAITTIGSAAVSASAIGSETAITSGSVINSQLATISNSAIVSGAASAIPTASDSAVAYPSLSTYRSPSRLGFPSSSVPGSYSSAIASDNFSPSRIASPNVTKLSNVSGFVLRSPSGSFSAA